MIEPGETSPARTLDLALARRAEIQRDALLDDLLDDARIELDEGLLATSFVRAPEGDADLRLLHPPGFDVGLEHEP